MVRIPLTRVQGNNVRAIFDGDPLCTRHLALDVKMRGGGIVDTSKVSVSDAVDGSSTGT